MLMLYNLISDNNFAARFGFFDLDATFAAAFVLVMMGVVDDDEQRPEGLRQAFDVLNYLSDAGNKAAERRLKDIQQFCSHVWPNDRPHRSSDNHPNRSQDVNAGNGAGGEARRPLGKVSSTNGNAEQVLHRPAMPTGTLPVDQMHWNDAMQPQPGNLLPTNQGFLDVWNSSDTMFGIDPYQFGIDLSREADGIYSSFHDPTFPLTGVDYSDWQEMERLFGTRNM
jgi:proline utilization trans-activator